MPKQMTKKNARKIEFHEVTMNDVHPLAQALLRMFDPEVTKHIEMRDRVSDSHGTKRA